MRASDKPLPQPPRNDRPSANWICGWSELGFPCTHGPSEKGGCPAIAECQPIEKDGQWVCNRPACIGGRCEPGPDQEGVCGLKPEPCQPRRSWHQLRRKATILCFLSALSAILVGLGGRWRVEVFAPGDLVQSHAQILGGQLNGDRCASCHPAARGQLREWFMSAGPAHADVTQTQLCMECHHTTIDRSLARNAHNLSLQQLNQIGKLTTETVSNRRWDLPKPEFAMDDVACATCHREHHGLHVNLAEVSSAQCQSCHKEQFHSFAVGHPDWTDWPYRRRASKIAFDHSTHAGKHFPQQSTTFNCLQCHPQGTDQEIAVTASYEVACAQCHDRPLGVSAAEGFAVLQYPMLDTEAMASSGFPVAEWPENARGVFDGKLPPLIRILLRSDPDVSNAIDRLPESGDLAHINPENALQLKALSQVARGIEQLMKELSDNTPEALADRLVQVTGADQQTALRLAGQLSPQLVRAARGRWYPERPALVVIPPQQRAVHFQPVGHWQILPNNPLRVLIPPPAAEPKQPVHIAQNPDPPDSDLSLVQSESAAPDPLDDPLFAPPPKSKKPKPKRFNPSAQLPSGGWFHDSMQLAVRYRPRGHGDDSLAALVEIAHSAPKLREKDREALLGLPAVESCLNCHRDVRQGQIDSWGGRLTHSGKKSFTVFSHRPHMNLPQLADCTHCHKVAPDSSNDSLAASPGHPEFLPLSRATCVACHTTQAAGQQCTKCHQYHIDAASFLGH